MAKLMLITDLTATENRADELFAVGTVFVDPVEKPDYVEASEDRIRLLADIYVAKQVAFTVAAAPAEFVFGENPSEISADVKPGPVKRRFYRLNDRILVHSGVGGKRGKKCKRAEKKRGQNEAPEK